MPTPDEVRAHINRLLDAPGWQPPAAFGVGVATRTPAGKVLDTWYPVVNVEENDGFAAVLADALGTSPVGTHDLGARIIGEVVDRLGPLRSEPGGHPNLDALVALAPLGDGSVAPTGNRRVPVVTFLGSLEEAPRDVGDVYLRLHLLSYCKVRPHGVSLEGVFGLLPNVVWTDLGPCDPEGFQLLAASLRAAGQPVRVLGVDKFPRMVDYVVPAGVRVADGNRVRLGAHLAEGTTVMHEGFVNFNAGTLGNAMVEGRISAGVVIGANSDLGGSASIMGTLSGGGKEVITVGEHCLIGANAGIGISLGDRCTVEAGLYVTAGTLVGLPDGATVKARELSGRDDLLFRRNSVTGRVEVLPRPGTWEGLNADLHAND